MMTDRFCPLCNGGLEPALDLRVCTGCHESLQLSGAVALSSTGEFAAMPGSHAARILGASPEVLLRDDSPSDECTWCGKSRSQVKKVLTRGDSRICNECVSLCMDILEMELGSDWR